MFLVLTTRGTFQSSNDTRQGSATNAKYSHLDEQAGNGKKKEKRQLQRTLTLLARIVKCHHVISIQGMTEKSVFRICEFNLIIDIDRRITCIPPLACYTLFIFS